MTREEKVEIVDRLSKKIGENGSFYIADASGLTVEQVNAFRRLCFDAGIEYGVYKNTLIRKALEKNEYDDQALFDTLKGFSGILFSREIGNIPAKILREYRKKTSNKNPLLKVASVEHELYFGDENLVPLSELKSKPELIADIVALLQSPLKNVLSALSSGQHTISALVEALKNDKNKE